MNLVLKAGSMSSICFGSAIGSAKDIASVENDDNKDGGNNIQSAFNEYELPIEVYCGDVHL